MKGIRNAVFTEEFCCFGLVFKKILLLMYSFIIYNLSASTQKLSFMFIGWMGWCWQKGWWDTGLCWRRTVFVPRDTRQSRGRVQLVKEFTGAAALVTLAQGEEGVMGLAKAMCHGFWFLLVTLEIEGIRRDCSSCVRGAVQGITEKTGIFFNQVK